MVFAVNIFDAVRALVVFSLIALIFYGFVAVPKAIASSVGLVWEHGNPFFLFAIAAGLVYFIYQLFKKTRRTSASLIAGIALIAGFAHAGDVQQKWSNSFEVGSPRTLLWAEAMYKLRFDYNLPDTFSRVMPVELREAIATVNVQQREHEKEDRPFKVLSTSIDNRFVIGQYNVSTLEEVQRYAQLAQEEGHGDWLAFYAECVMVYECRDENLNRNRTIDVVNARYGIDLIDGFTRYFESGSKAANFRENGFGRTCHEDELCSNVMYRIGVQTFMWERV